MLGQLNFVPGFVFSNDVTYLEFLNRVQIEIERLSSSDSEANYSTTSVVFHPWINLFLPKSRVRDFQIGVFQGILRNVNPTGLVLFYPMNKNRYVYIYIQIEYVRS